MNLYSSGALEHICSSRKSAHSSCQSDFHDESCHHHKANLIIAFLVHYLWPLNGLIGVTGLIGAPLKVEAACGVAQLAVLHLTITLGGDGQPYMQVALWVCFTKFRERKLDIFLPLAYFFLPERKWE